MAESVANVDVTVAGIAPMTAFSLDRGCIKDQRVIPLGAG